MKMRTSLLAILVATVLVGGASAHLTVTSEPPAGPFVVGETYVVPTSLWVNCAAFTFEYIPGVHDQVTASIVNSADYAWLNASEEDVMLAPSDCEVHEDAPAVAEGAPEGGTYARYDVDISFSIGATAPGMETFTLQPGAFDENNQGGAFDVIVPYNPAFTAPTALSFDAVGGTATATIPLTMAANADSVFNFDVTSFTFDGEPAPEGAMAHIQETKEVATGIATEEGVTATTVDLHFGVSGGHDAMEDMDHGDDDMEHDDHESEDGGHFHWETAQAVVSITLASKDDATKVSDAKLVALTFTNTDMETMPHDDEHTDTDSGDDEGFFKFLPGFGPIGVIAAIGAVAALRRRN